MSGIEVLGVAASAAQLTVYCISIVSSISKILERVRNAPRQYYEYACQVRLLINSVRRIEQNPVLQTADIHYLLNSALAEAQTLQSILDSAAVKFAKNSVKWKYWTAIKGSEQQKIFAHLESLQQNKTALLLCISTLHTTQLSSMQGRVDRLLDVSLEIEKNCASIRPTEVNNGGKILPPRLDIDSMAMVQVQNDLITTHRQTKTYRSRNTVNGSHNFGLVIIKGNSTVSNGNTINDLTNGNADNGTTIGKIAGSRHQYKDILISEGPRVHNGNIGIGRLEGHDFQRIEIGGWGIVKNGDFNNAATLNKEWAELKEM